MLKIATIRCTNSGCGRDFTEIIDLPMLLKPAVRRMESWICPKCGCEWTLILSFAVFADLPKQKE